MSEKLLPVTDINFQKEVLESNVLTLVDFWAPWCVPCKMLTPVLEELAEEYKGRVKFTSVNTDDSPLTSMQLGIRSIPTVIVFKDGQMIDTRVGAQPKKVFSQILDKNLA